MNVLNYRSEVANKRLLARHVAALSSIHPWLWWPGFAIRLLLLLAASSGLAATDPTRIGVFVARMSLTASGTSGGKAQSKDSSSAWNDSYSWTLQSETRQEVVQATRDVYTAGKILESGSSEGISGGGNASGDGGSVSWTYLPNPGFNATNNYVSGSLNLNVGKASTASASRRSYLPPEVFMISPTGATPMDGAWQAVMEAVNNLRSTRFDVSSNLTTGWSYSKTVSTNVSWSVGEGDANATFSSTTSASASCTYSVEFIPEGAPQWEAVLQPNPYGSLLPSFDQWIPVGGTNENKAGGSCVAHVFLRGKSDPNAIPPLAHYTVQLSDVSREPGICMNFPGHSVAGGGGDAAPYDLQIAPNKDLTVAADGQYADTTSPLKELNLGIQTYDYGAFGKLKVTAKTTDGQTLVAYVDGHPDHYFLAIPQDENQNHVADAWEKDSAIAVFDRNLDAKWEGTLDSRYDGQALEGDGISLYEKYRGFYVLKTGGDPVHERLDPKLKYLFVHNPDRLVQEVFRSEDGQPVSYTAAAKCEVRYVTASGWSGPGAFKDKKRIVNFNYTKDKHVVDQHALYVKVNPSKNPFKPEDWIKLLNSNGIARTNEPIGRREEGCAYPDATAPAAFLVHKRPASSYWIEIYAASVTNYVFDTVLYHTRGDCGTPCDDNRLNTLAGAFIGSNVFSFQTKYTIELSASMTHEMGHGTGVKHHKPENSDPKNSDLANCTMRYYGPKEFPINVGDRFEIFARGHNPNMFCRNIFNCWGQLQVTDNPDAAKGAAPASLARLRPSQVSLAGILPPFPVETRLELSADLDWPDLVAGDPLRLWVRLHGTTSVVPPNWPDGLVMTLRRLSDSGQPEVVLEPDQWPALLQPATFDTRLLAITNVTQIREFLVPPEIAGLDAGRYTLEIAWQGAAFAPDMLLPTNGVITIPAIEFEVQAATNTTNQALGHRHRAWYDYLTDNFPGVLTHTREADRLDPDSSEPLAIQARLMRATAAANRDAPLETAQVLDNLRRQLPSEDNHVAEMAAEHLSQLVPRLSVLEGPTAGQELRLAVTAIPGQKYILQGSTDLATWTSISTNTPGASQFDWPNTSGADRPYHFYRVLWSD